MTTPIRHIKCAAIAMWYVGPPYKTGQAMRSADVIYLDGSRPRPADQIPNCPACKEAAGGFGFSGYARCFDEDLDPGPAVMAAIEQKLA